MTREMVAQRAGVCKQTVSCYLNKSRGVSKELAEKIEGAIRELNYVPNMVARGLSQKKTMSLAVICDDLGNPNYSEILRGIEQEANSRAYSVLIFDMASGNDSIVNQIIARRVDGVILLTFPYKIGDGNIRKLEDNGVRIVVTHSAGEIIGRYMQLEPDFLSGIEETLSELKKRGHEEIVMLSCFDREATPDKRLDDFIDCYEKLFARPARFVTDKTSREASLESGIRLAERMLAEHIPASAVIATNDLMAIGAMKAFSEAGLIDKISVVGFDNMIFSEYVTPSLSSIGYDKLAYGKKLFDMFFESSGGAPGRVVYVKTKLFLRGSIRDLAR